jgi:hypothetical protein
MHTFLGRPTLIHGYDFHVEQCRTLFDKRESLKPPHERRKCPADPALMDYRFEGFKSSKLSQRDLDELNQASNKTFIGTLSVCRNCGRSFLPDKLIIHNKSCTSNNPARRVDEAVKRGQNNTSDNDYTNYSDNSYNEKSNSTKIRKSSFSNAVEYMDNGNLVTCNDCGRNFNSSSFAKFCFNLFLLYYLQSCKYILF